MGTEGALTVDNPYRSQRDALIMQDRLSGMTMRQIATKHGIDPSVVCRILNQDEIKEAMEQEARIMVSLVPHAVDTYKDVLLNEKDNKVRLSAAKDILQNTGIGASHTTSVIIQNSFNHQSVELTPEVVELMNSRPSEQVIDVDLGLND
jgi:hypothetical protein